VLVRRLLVALLALLGIAALAGGIGLRTVWLPDDEVRATFTTDEGAPVLVTAPGVLETRPGPVTVEATTPDDAPVLLAIGREGDVEAWVGEAAHTTVTQFTTEQTLTGETVEGEAEVPNPAGSDLWVQVEDGEGTATLEYAATGGSYVLLAASDGVAPAPQELTLTWPHEVTTPWSLPLIVLGALLVVGAAALTVVLWRGSRAGRS